MSRTVSLQASRLAFRMVAFASACWYSSALAGPVLELRKRFHASWHFDTDNFPFSFDQGTSFGLFPLDTLLLAENSIAEAIIVVLIVSMHPYVVSIVRMREVRIFLYLSQLALPCDYLLLRGSSVAILTTSSAFTQLPTLYCTTVCWMVAIPSCHLFLYKLLVHPLSLMKPL